MSFDYNGFYYLQDNQWNFCCCDQKNDRDGGFGGLAGKASVGTLCIEPNVDLFIVGVLKVLDWTLYDAFVYFAYFG